MTSGIVALFHNPNRKSGIRLIRVIIKEWENILTKNVEISVPVGCPLMMENA